MDIPIPMDDRVKTGQLENGLRYFIHKMVNRKIGLSCD